MPTLAEARDTVRGLSQKALDITRDDKLTPGEQKAALDLIDPDLKSALTLVGDMEHIETKRAEFFAATGQTFDDAGTDGALSPAKSLGEQFVDSAGYKQLLQKGMKGAAWSSGAIELKVAGTVSEGTSGTPGPGYPFVSTPRVLPGIVGINFAPLTVADIIPSSATDTPLVRYLVETAVTNAAATVAEGGNKPQSDLTFAKVDEVLHKIATFLAITDEMLEDVAQAQGYINQRLTLFVQIAEEVQLLSGDGTGSNLVGLLNRAGLATAIVKGTAPSVAGDNSMDALLRQITAIRTTSWLEPDSIVMDPTVWQDILLSKNSQGAYYANGPFMDATNPTLWGKRVVVSSRMAAATALVGAFAQAAQIFRRGGITVEASNSHASYFTSNLTAIRAEERLGLAVYRPGAFGIVSAL